MSWDVEALPSGCLLYTHARFARRATLVSGSVKRRKKSAEPRNSGEGAIPMPFGQYKGAPLAAIVADIPYVQWLLAQDWFAEKFPEHRRYLDLVSRNSTEGPSAA